jgi:hypothetical protein
LREWLYSSSRSDTPLLPATPPAEPAAAAADDDGDAAAPAEEPFEEELEPLDMGVLNSKEAIEVSHLVREFISDELKYVQDLDVIEALFIEPLRKPSKQARFALVDASAFSFRVFANWSSIRELHRDMVVKLLETCTTARRATPKADVKKGKKGGGGGGGGDAAGASGSAAAGGGSSPLVGGFDVDPTQILTLRARAHRTLPAVFLEFVPFFKLYSEYLKVQQGHLLDNTSSADADPDVANVSFAVTCDCR